MFPIGVTAQWLKFSLNKFRERFQIREIREMKDPRNISAIRYIEISCCSNGWVGSLQLTNYCKKIEQCKNITCAPGFTWKIHRALNLLYKKEGAVNFHSANHSIETALIQSFCFLHLQKFILQSYIKLLSSCSSYHHYHCLSYCCQQSFQSPICSTTLTNHKRHTQVWKCDPPEFLQETVPITWGRPESKATVIPLWLVVSKFFLPLKLPLPLNLNNLCIFSSL